MQQDFYSPYSFFSNKKILLSLSCSLACIAPVLAAKVIPGCSVTVGQDTDEGGRWPYAGTAGAVVTMGATHSNKAVTISFN